MCCLRCPPLTIPHSPPFIRKASTSLPTIVVSLPASASNTASASNGDEGRIPSDEFALDSKLVAGVVLLSCSSLAYVSSVASGCYDAHMSDVLPRAEAGEVKDIGHRSPRYAISHCCRAIRAATSISREAM